MKISPPVLPSVTRARGMTLVELTVMIAVLLGMAAVLFIGARAWKRGSDRAGCVVNIRNVQMAVRSYQNVYGYAPGSSPAPEYGTQDIARHLFEKSFIVNGLFAAMEGSKPCPGGGTYQAPARNLFPLPGELFMECSLVGSEKHGPQEHGDW